MNLGSFLNIFDTIYCRYINTGNKVIDLENIAPSGGGGGGNAFVDDFALQDNDMLDCVSLLRFDTSPIVDEIGELTWNISTASLSNSILKYEPNSLVCNSSSKVSCICSDVLRDLFTNGFTIDFWQYYSSHGEGGAVYLGVLGGSDSYQLLEIYQGVHLYTQHSYRGDIPLSAGWNYVSLNFYGNYLYVYVNGVYRFACYCPYVAHSSNGIYINAGRTADRYFNGYISDFKITRGAKHLTNDFGVPSEVPSDEISYKFSRNGLYRDTNTDMVYMCKSDADRFRELNFVRLG